MTKLKAAVIGTGNMGFFHAKNYFELDEIELVAVADINKEKGEKTAKEFNCKFYSDYKELAEKEKLDIVSIVVPTKKHKEVAIFFIEKGINTLIEKPIAGTIEDAEEIIKASEKNKVKLTIGHIERFNPAVIALKKLIKSGRLGEINSIIVRRVGIYPPQIKDANVIIDLAVHDIDIINYLLERLPDKVSANSGKAVTGNKKDYADIFMKYGKTSAVVQVNWITPVKIRKMNITGSKGYAEMDYITQEITMFESNCNIETDSFKDFVVKFAPSEEKIAVEKEQPLKKELVSFIKSIKEGSEPEVTTKRAVDALKIALEVDSKTE